MFKKKIYLLFLLPIIFFTINCGDLEDVVGDIIDENKPYCGDGVANTASESCDSNGYDTTNCDNDCTLPVCGDGLHNANAGEQCDYNDANSIPTGYDCNNACELVPDTDGYCGNGGPQDNPPVPLDPGEECDPGNAESASCDIDCTLVTCDDGYINVVAGEECDVGIHGTLFCNEVSCTINPAFSNTCGDSVVYEPDGEQCDDGNTIAGDGCDDLCQIESSNYPEVTALTIDGTGSGAGGAFQAGDTVTVSWSATSSVGIAGFMVLMLPDFDFTQGKVEPPIIYSSDPNMESMLPPDTTSYEITLPDALSGTYYPALLVADSLDNGIIIFYNSLVSSANFTIHLGIPDQGVFGSLIASNVAKDSITMTSSATCGDGVRQVPEMCDDGNNVPGDGCNSICNREPAGACDIAALTGVASDVTAINVSAGDRAAIAVDADFTCVERMEVRLIETTGSNAEKWIYMNYVDGDTFAGIFPPNQWVSSGDWTIGGIMIEDGNRQRHGYAISQVDNTVFTYMASPDWGWDGTGGTDTLIGVLTPIAVTGGAVDTTKPTLSAVSVSGTPTGGGGNYLAGDVVTVTATVTDNLSGVEGVDIKIQSDDWEEFGRCWTSSSLPGTNDYSCSITLTGVNLVDPLTVYPSVHVRDVAQNGVHYSRNTQNAPPYPANYFTYENNTMFDSGVAITDLTLSLPSPTIFSNLAVDGGAVTGINVADFSGLWLTFDATQGNRYTINFNDDAEGDGTFSADISIEVFDDAGNNLRWAKNGYKFGVNLLALNTGKIYIRVRPDSTGTFGIQVVSTEPGVGTWGKCLNENTTDGGGNPITYTRCSELKLGGSFGGYQLEYAETNYYDTNTNEDNARSVEIASGTYSVVNQTPVATNLLDITTDGSGNVTGVTAGSAVDAYQVDLNFTSLDVMNTSQTDVDAANLLAECGGNLQVGSYDWDTHSYTNFNNVNATCATVLFSDVNGYHGLPLPGTMMYTLFGVVNDAAYTGSEYEIGGTNPVYSEFDPALRPVYLNGTKDGNDEGMGRRN